MKIKWSFRHLLWGMASLCIAAVVFIGALNIMVAHFSQKYLYTDVSVVPYNKVGLLLGTAQILPDGRKNRYFTYRIDAAAELFKSGKISYIIASGDNHTTSYNEPQAMRQALIDKGVPDSAIVLDYAGFRTLDSVVRCREIFGQDSFTVISQKFHNERAVYIGRKLGINIIGYNASDVMSVESLKTIVREYAAKVVAVTDVAFGRAPKFLGQKISVP